MLRKVDKTMLIEDNDVMLSHFILQLRKKTIKTTQLL